MNNYEPGCVLRVNPLSLILQTSFETRPAPVMPHSKYGQSSLFIYINLSAMIICMK